MVTVCLNYIHAFQILVIATSVILLLKLFESSPENLHSENQRINNYHEPSVLLAVISARRNFRQREAIRSSWGSAVKNLKQLELKFFVGEECAVPLLDRKDEHSCQEASIDADMHQSTNMFWGRLNCKEYSPNHFSPPCYSGFGFRVTNPIKINSIGVHYELLRKNENLQVVFQDPEEVLDTIVARSSSCDIILNSFCFIKLKTPFILPDKFEGELFLSVTGELKPTSETCFWKNDDLVYFTFGRTANGVEKYNSKMCSYIIANFSLPDFEHFNKLNEEKLKLKLEWAEELKRVEENLQLEIKKHQDVILLPNVTDVYRNLPLKCLKVFQWSRENSPSSSVLKLDDDVYANVKFLLELISSEWFHSENLAIWSHFYYNRAVPIFGKWADFEFASLTYPPFPSGSGYLITRRLVELLSSKAPFLRSFQGEDISMGIWTEVLQHEGETVKKNSVKCWLNSPTCEEAFIIPELTLEQMENYMR